MVANGADIPADPMNVVVLTDDPATSENEALGCSLDAYLKAGINLAADAPKQIAVTTRGTCARVARAVFGQQAGADAVLMINNADSLPPYEGPITENPDTGEQYTVTIPFYGVRSSDGAAVKAASTITAAAKDIANPGFSAYGSFTSAGPVSITSGLKPTVTAPGVSISSAAVGSGSGAQYMSGTSMAAPNVAGVAALGVQAHPEWSGQDVTDALSSTAVPADVADYRLTRGGGLVNAGALVNSSVFAYGDSVDVDGTAVHEAGLSFGFAELAKDFTGTKTVTVVNKGTSARTFNVSYAATEESLPANVSLDKSTVTVPAGGSAEVKVTLKVKATDIPASMSGDTQHSFYEVSGNVVLTDGDDTLTVGALLVPRPATNVEAKLNKGNLNGRSGGTPVTFTNRGAVTDGDADLFTWGLQDAKDQTVSAGFDLQAAGVQSFPMGEDQLLVFGISTHDRFSNGASIEFDVQIDADRDGSVDYIVFSYDSGAVRAGDADGLAEVFIQDVKTKALYASGFLSVAPTDSSVLLLPVLASFVDVDGAFDYSAATFYGDSEADEFTSVATYNASAKAYQDGQFVEVPAGKTATLTVNVNADQVKAQKPLGLMAVSYDNRAGKEALLVRGK